MPTKPSPTASGPAGSSWRSPKGRWRPARPRHGRKRVEAPTYSGDPGDVGANSRRFLANIYLCAQRCRRLNRSLGFVVLSQDLDDNLVMCKDR
jgi:hypothetical protein